MAMPDKKTTRPYLVALAERTALASADVKFLAALLLPLADQEWEREERAAELEALQADRELKAAKEDA